MTFPSSLPSLTTLQLDSKDSYNGFTNLLDISWKVPHCFKIIQLLEILVRELLQHSGLRVPTRQCLQGDVITFMRRLPFMSQEKEGQTLRYTNFSLNLSPGFLVYFFPIALSDFMKSALSPTKVALLVAYFIILNLQGKPWLSTTKQTRCRCQFLIKVHTLVNVIPL